MFETREAETDWLAGVRCVVLKLSLGNWEERGLLKCLFVCHLSCPIPESVNKSLC